MLNKARIKLAGVVERCSYRTPITFKSVPKVRYISLINGIFVIGLAVMLAIYGGILFKKLIGRNEWKFNQNIKKTNLNEDPSPTNITDFDGIEFKITYVNDVTSFLAPQEDILWVIDHYVDYIEVNSTGEYHLEELKYTKCSDSIKDVVVGDNFMEECFTLDNKELSGDQSGVNKFKTIAIMNSICVTKGNYLCENREILDQAIVSLKVMISVKSKYVDLSDSDDPIKEYTENLFDIPLHPKMYKYGGIFIERQEVTLDDSIFSPFFEPTQIKFNKVANREKHQVFTRLVDELDGYPYFGYRMLIKLSDETVRYSRQAFTFLELTGTLGGIFEVGKVSLSFLFGLVYSYFSKKSLVNEIKKNTSMLVETQKELQALKKMVQNSNPPQYEKENNVVISDEQKKNIENSKEEEHLVSSQIKKFGSNSLFNKMTEESKRLHFEVESTIQRTKTNHFMKHDISDPTGIVAIKSQTKEILKEFDEQTDCLNILFRIQSLEAKVSYLLYKDPEYNSKYCKPPSQPPSQPPSEAPSQAIQLVRTQKTPTKITIDPPKLTLKNLAHRFKKYRVYNEEEFL
ncbi:unnamed protein product [Moneuplotes crassus]|uniref:Uncharacterized protein n=1 Tax=Euplotes crassus TaxID=5936 RepID=A0AAD1Y6B9_EUPCR|nr:unnamed protein product [Moneuplotes crassus]